MKLLVELFVVVSYTSTPQSSRKKQSSNREKLIGWLLFSRRDSKQSVLMNLNANIPGITDVIGDRIVPVVDGDMLGYNHLFI